MKICRKESGATGFHHTSRYPRIEALKLLLERNDIDTTIKNNFGKTAEDVRYGEAWRFWSKYKENNYKKFW